jgi:tryptophanyl-tRNA synthetase
MEVVSSPDTVKYFDEQYNNCSIRYGDLKKQLAEDMVSFTAPFREKIKELSSDDAFLHKVACLGRDKARESAAKTISDIRHIIGFREF